MEGLVIREAVAEDLAKIGALSSTNSRDTYDDKYVDYRYLESLTVEYCTNRITNYFSTPGNHVLVAEYNGEFAGYVAGRPSPDVLGAFWMEYLDVAEDTQNSGIGKSLVSAMGRQARDDGYGQMIADVYKGNDKAEGIFRHLGAEVMNEDYMQDIEGFLVKSKLLVWNDLSLF